MTFNKFAATCVGAALSLAMTSFASIALAADTTTTTTWKPAEPPPLPSLDIHGFFDVTFANDYVTPRGLLVTNTGLTTQIVNGLTFSLYKNPDTWINSFSITAGTFNDLWSEQNSPTVGSWNEFDWWVSAPLPNTGRPVSPTSRFSVRQATSRRSATLNHISASMMAR